MDRISVVRSNTPRVGTRTTRKRHQAKRQASTQGLLDDAASGLALLCHVARGIRGRLTQLRRDLDDDDLVRMLAQCRTGWTRADLPVLLRLLVRQDIGSIDANPGGDREQSPDENDVTSDFGADRAT